MVNHKYYQSYNPVQQLLAIYMLDSILSPRVCNAAGQTA